MIGMPTMKAPTPSRGVVVDWVGGGSTGAPPTAHG